MARQQLRSLADEYGLKPADARPPPPTPLPSPPPPPPPPPPPSPSPSLQASEQQQREDPAEAEREGGARPAAGAGEEEEEEECGFCLFMKGGGCKESFVAWELCMQEAESKKEDLVEKCYQVTGRLMQCMEEHADYYEPILRAEKAMKEEVARGLERERGGPSESTTD